ncbi:hypothetical protein CcaCcLH18_06305 [Colletotrichum camelliae]|nr:hypothetical protein CcaCcLH18_06305 [Colletotrichum camelliae]
MEMKILPLHQKCDQHFKSVCDASHTSDKFQMELQDEHDKYTLWAVNVGAGHPDRWSLDYRLREASLYQSEVISILEIMLDALDKVRDILIGARVPFEKLRTSTTLRQEHHGSEVSSPWEIPFDSDDETSLIRHPPASGSRQRDPGPITQSEADQLLSSIRFDTYAKVAHHEEYDKKHVRDTLPNRRLPNEVMDRLGKMITKRRQLLLYRKERDEKLQSLIAEPAEKDSEAGIQSQSQQSRQQHTVITNATTTQPEALFTWSDSQSNSESTRTSIAASRVTKDIPIDVPPQPVDKDDEQAMFLCNYCKLPTKAMSDKEWKKHLLRDLQPFVCTFADCPLSSHSFEDEDAWFSHEVDKHRYEYFCNNNKHQPEAHQHNFEMHLQRDHATEAGISTVDLSMFRRAANVSKGVCNLCFSRTKNLKRHIARHLYQIALSAIPNSDYTTIDDASGAAETSNSFKSDRARRSLSNRKRSSEYSDSDAMSTMSRSQTDTAEYEDVEGPQSANVGPITTDTGIPTPTDVEGRSSRTDLGDELVSRSKTRPTASTKTYHLAPTFNIPPPPTGPLHLGTIVTDLSSLRVLNQSHRHEIPEIEVFQDLKSNFVFHMQRAQTGIFARFLELSGIGLTTGVKLDKDLATHADTLLTVSFHPTSEYIRKCVAEQPVVKFLKHGRGPVYMITGIKIVKGGSLTSQATPLALLEVDSTVNSGTATWKSVADFVLAIKVVRIRSERQSFRAEDKDVEFEVFRRGAVLY